MNFYAHTHPDHSNPTEAERFWEPLFSEFGQGLNACSGYPVCEKCREMDPKHGHLNKVAWWTAKFMQDMFPEGSDDGKRAAEWGYLAGLWHDLGKFAPEWQEYLKKKVDPHIDEVIGKVDHSTAGAKFTHDLSGLGDLFSYIIAGHHAGLPDGDRLFNDRLKKEVSPWLEEAKAAGVPLENNIPMPPLTRPNVGNDAMAFMLRFCFAALVDADFVATESFMSLKNYQKRPFLPDDLISRMLGCLEGHFREKFGGVEDSPVNRARETVRRDCEQAADGPSGFYSLTVPTGGGKTLSSLLFALRHALKNSLRRVIYVIPYTSIIKQNADVFREVFKCLSIELGQEIVLEHHSKFDPSKETEQNRLSAENWDAPLIVTTNVQFFESLFANKTGACRKLHRIARSVVIFDEVQALPTHLLVPILRGLRCLVHDLNTTAVLCTATQPAFEMRDGFPVGIPPEEITEIIQKKKTLFDSLERVTCQNLGTIDDSRLVSHILNHSQEGCLLILNTTKAAHILHEKLNVHTTALHLSARMCPRHIMLILTRAKRLRKLRIPVVLVATQLIEAGVDISFPVVYRAECGLDSFAQAAGRCNRNGELSPAKGRVFLFQPEEHRLPKGLADLVAKAAVTRTQISPNFAEEELLSLAAIRSYFEHAIWNAGLSTRWDKHHIVSGDMACFESSSQTLKAYSFKTAAERFRLIDSNTHSVLIPWGPKGRKLCDKIRSLKLQNRVPSRFLYRSAQQFTVQVYDGEWEQLKPSLSFHCEEAFAILDHPENDYDSRTGLKRPGTACDPNAFIL